jgi:DNA-binding SARP family transcriptional activator/tetratricopeptide (TPR) repeat protein
LDFRTFGRTSVFRDQVQLDLGGRKASDVLTLLLAAEGRVVPAERLVDQLWRGRAPVSAMTTLHGHIARLRRLLEPGRTARESQLLVSEAGGYALRVPRAAVDVHALEDSVTAAGQSLAEDAWTPVADALRRAEGVPYGDVADVVDLVPVVANIEEVVRTASDDLAEVRLRHGDARGARAFLEKTVAAQPLRERTHLLLAGALDADGRAVDALALLRAFRARLADETGFDPSPAFDHLEGAILRQEKRPPAPAPVPVVPGPATGSLVGLVGRTDELATMQGVASGVLRAGASAVVVTGEPGIGKTALIDAFAREFRAAYGADVRTGRALEAAGQPPHWLWQQVLGGVLESPGSSDAGAHFAFATEMTRRLRALAAEAPLLVQLDDLQWADHDSLQALHIVIESLRDERIVLVLVCREEAMSDPDVTTCLVAAARMPGARRVALGALSDEAVEALVRQLSDEATAEAFSDAIARRSGGNPLFATELALLGEASLSTLPAGVRDVVRLRADRLGYAARDLLSAVALGGGALPISVALAAAGAEGNEGIDAMNDALASGMLVELPPERVAVRHDLVRETLVAELRPTQRAALHARVADALAVSPGAPMARAAIAVHRSEASPAGVDESAAAACLVAAREAADRAGAMEAIELSGRGLRHVTERESTVKADLHEVRAAALRRVGRIEDSAADLRSLAQLGRSTGNETLTARAALGSAGGGTGGYWGSAGSVWATDESLLEEAAAHLERLPTSVQHDLEAALAIYRAATGRDAVSLADRASQSGTARAAMAGIVCRWTPAHATDRLARAREMLQAFRHDPVEQATALHLLRCALLETGQVDEFHAVDDRLARLTARVGDGDLLLLELWWRAGLALARGTFDEARTLADRAVSEAAVTSPAAADITRASRQTVEGVIAWHERRMASLVPDVVDLASTLDADWLLVLAQAYAQAGRHEESLRAVERVEGAPRRGVREAAHTVLLADVIVEVGDTARAVEILTRLEKYGDTIVTPWPGTTVLGPTAYYRGRVKQLLGLDAEAELERAVELSRRFDLAPFERKAMTALTI